MEMLRVNVSLDSGTLAILKRMANERISTVSAVIRVLVAAEVEREEQKRAEKKGKR